MILVAVGSAKGSPGATTASLALALTWPGSAPLLVEADPDGGSLAMRAGRSADPGLVSLAAAVRHGPATAAAMQHTQELPSGVPCVLGPPSADQARGALVGVDHLLASLGDGPVVADCGRLSPASPAQPFVDAADLVLLVVRASPDALQHLPSRLAAADEHGRSVALLLVGDRPYDATEIATALDVDVAGVLSHDPRAAGSLARLPSGHRALRHSPLLRSARDVSASLAARFAPPARPEVHDPS